MNALRLAEQPLANVPGGASSFIIHSPVGDGLAQPLAEPAGALGPAFDLVLGALLDANPHDTLIGDLAFEQVSSATRKLRGIAALGTTS
jgi:hypothetical protein